MKIHHIAIWTFQPEKLREFYIRYFHGKTLGLHQYLFDKGIE